MRIFFTTDIHGSEACFKKLLRAREFYEVDAIVLGGDYTSKSLLVCVRGRDGTVAKLDGKEVRLTSREEVESFRKWNSDRGRMTRVVDEEEYRDAERNPERRDQWISDALRELLTHWTEMADEAFSKNGCKIYQIPGNDEPLFCDEFFNDAPFVPLDGRHIRLNDHLAILGIGGSTPTPWETPREYSEQEIEDCIAKSLDKNLAALPLIFVAHVPPLNSGLDEAPALKNDYAYKLSFGAPEKVYVGSQAIRRAVENLRPIAGLFGHVHEARGKVIIGKTVCVNPGSAFDQGRLQGCIVSIENGNATAQFTEG
jgi:Icc-related predicted phosphoesterase